MKYKKRPVLTEATQWFINGDHPQDQSTPIDTGDPAKAGRLTEGKVVRHFRSLKIPGGRFCPECGQVMLSHGMMAPGVSVEEDVIVHPGDYIITHPTGKFYPMRQEDFERMFEPIEE